MAGDVPLRDICACFYLSIGYMASWTYHCRNLRWVCLLKHSECMCSLWSGKQQDPRTAVGESGTPTISERPSVGVGSHHDEIPRTTGKPLAGKPGRTQSTSEVSQSTRGSVKFSHIISALINCFDSAAGWMAQCRKRCLAATIHSWRTLVLGYIQKMIQ